MKLNNVEVLITKIEPKKTKDGVDYLSINFLDLASGDNFQVISKEIEYMKLKPMTKYDCVLNLSDSKYGLRLEIDKIGEEKGSI